MIASIGGTGVLLLAASTEGLRAGLVATAFGFGFRHGIDWDHIAAITDITSSQESPRRSMFFATLYAAGHAVVVFGLGLAAIVLAANLPSSLDAVMERFVGVTLLILGVYVFYALVRHGREFRMRSRWMLVFAGARRGLRWLRDRRLRAGYVVVAHDHDHPAYQLHPDPADHALVRAGGSSVGAPAHRHHHRHLAPMPDDPFLAYGRATAFLVGMIHGVGAETPTQVLIFLAAAEAGGRGAGVVLLGCFLAGVVSSNTAIALASTYGFLRASRDFRLYVAVSVLTATFSLAIGTLFLLGRSTLLPAIFGG